MPKWTPAPGASSGSRPPAAPATWPGGNTSRWTRPTGWYSRGAGSRRTALSTGRPACCREPRPWRWCSSRTATRRSCACATAGCLPSRLAGSTTGAGTLRWGAWRWWPREETPGPVPWKSYRARGGLSLPGRDLLGQHGRVLGHAQERGRPALALEVHAHEVEPVYHRAGSVLLDGEAELVEGGWEPDPARVVGPEAGGEDDGSEAAQLQLLGGSGPERGRRWHVGRLDSSLGAGLPDEGADVGVEGVAEGDRSGQVRREASLTVIHAEEAPQQYDARVLQRPEVEIVAPSPAAQLRVGPQARRGAGQVGQGRLHEGRLGDPRHGVAAFEPAWDPGSPSAGEIGVVPGLGQLPR